MDRNRGSQFKVGLLVVLSALIPVVQVRANTRDDAWITTRSQAALHFVAGGHVSTVAVTTIDGRVTLRGKVRSAAAKLGAAEEVRKIAGVVHVRNLLQVADTGSRQRLQRSDSAIKADVRRLFKADRFLADSDIVVESVNRGVVLLGGTAGSIDDLVRALQTAGQRPGVRRVLSRVGSPEWISVSSATSLVGVPIQGPASTRYAPVDAGDDAIRRGVGRALLDLDATGNANIQVAVTDGVVRLTGNVPSWDGNSSRLNATRSVTGVRSILNLTQVVAANVERR
jgi:osmotically-inducible protein OsmY